MVALSVPANGPMSDPFGPRSTVPGSPFHHGQDIGFYNANKDFRVFAAAPGTVTGVYWDSALGNSIEITHADGSKTGYHHLADSGLVAVGQTVVRRQHIGTEGATGTAAVVHGVPQTHLHFVYWVNGVRVDPAQYFTGTSGGDITPIPEEEENNMALSITHIYRKDVSELYMFASPTIVSVSRELSTLKGDARESEDNTMRMIALAANLGPDFVPLLIDDSPNGGWYLRDQIAGRIAGMPAQFPLSVSNPFILKSGSTAASGASSAEVTAAADRVIAAVPTAEQNGSAARTAIVKG